MLCIISQIGIKISSLAPCSKLLRKHDRPFMRQSTLITWINDLHIYYIIFFLLWVLIFHWDKSRHPKIFNLSLSFSFPALKQTTVPVITIHQNGMCDSTEPLYLEIRMLLNDCNAMTLVWILLLWDWFLGLIWW